jgi:hypothetical protein
MNISRTIFLVVALTAAGGLHAQNCSGGPDGGMDATGNQCGTSTDVAANTTGTETRPSAQPPESGDVQQSDMAAPLAVLSKVVPGETLIPEVAMALVSRTEEVTVAASVSTSSTQIEIASVTSCSGGPDGGMDATGNQCNAAPDAVEITLLALSSPRT